MTNTPDYTRKAVDNYRKKFDMMQLRLPKGTKDRIEKHFGNVHGFIVSCVMKELDSLETPVEHAELPQIAIKNDEANTSVDFSELPPVIRETEDEEILELRKEKPNNDYITFPEPTGDLEKDNENFNEYIAKVKEMRDKANKERIEIRKIESERGNM